MKEEIGSMSPLQKLYTGLHGLKTALIHATVTYITNDQVNDKKIAYPMILKLVCPNHQRGRPADPRKDAQIIAAADKLFMTYGVQGTTMEHIARDADVSKLTLYRRYPDKNALFTAVITEKCSKYMPDCVFEAEPGTPPEELLSRVGQALLALITSEDAVNLNRVITTESAHNPELTAQFYAAGPQRIKTRTLELMTQFKNSGTLNISDPAEAAEMFSALISGCEFCKRCNMNMAPTPTPEQVKAYVDKATAFFIRAYSFPTL